VAIRGSPHSTDSNCESSVLVGARNSDGIRAAGHTL